MNKKYTFTFLALIVITLQLAAQQNFPSDVPTPNATSLGKYGDVPVSLYSGQAEVSVPLYSMNVKGLEMSISMNYDTRGVQLNTLPSWTGENWTLNAGGVIVRSVRGRADEFLFPNRIIEALRSSSSNIHLGHVATPKSYFQCPDTVNTYFSNNSLSNDSLFNHIYFNTFDLEPDMFTFNFMGHVGKFYLGNDGEWKVESNENIDVIFDISESSNYRRPFIEKYPAAFTKNESVDVYQPKTIFGFKLRDEKGFIYEFGNDSNAIEYSTPFFCASELENEYSWIANSWYLTKVYDKFGNKLYDLNYHRGSFATQIYNEEGWHYWNAQTYNLRMTGGSESPTHEFPYGLQLNSPVYLDNILASSGVKVQFYSKIDTMLLMSNLYYDFCHDAINGTNRNLQVHCNKYTNSVSHESELKQPFYYLQNSDFSQYHANKNKPDYNTLDYSNTSQLLARTGLEKLNSITIIPDSLSYSKYKKLVFSYDFNSRMHLTGIKETYGPENYYNSRIYHFEYENYDSLPSNYLTRAVDHWGYYNGQEYTCPVTWNNAISFYLQREPDSIRMKYGSLKKIIYPTGGVSVLGYEPNEYSSAQSPDRGNDIREHGIGCGLRIKSISDYNDTCCNILLKQKTYCYTDGQLFAKPRYVWTDWMPNQCLSVNTFRTTSIVPLSNTFGPSIGYSHVEEKLIDGCKTVWEYTNYSDFRDYLLTDNRFNSQEITPYDRFCERGYSRGKPKSIEYYDSSRQKVKSTYFTYRSDLSDTAIVENYSIYAANLAVELMGSYYYTGRFYRIFFPRYDLMEVSDTVFLQNGNAISKIEYERSDHEIAMNDGHKWHKSMIRVLDGTREERYASNGTINDFLYKVNYYPQLSNDNFLYKLSSNQFDIEPIATAVFHDGKFIKCDSIVYSSEFTNNEKILLPKYYLTRYASVTDTTGIALSYDRNNMSLTKYQNASGQKTQLYWAHNGCYIACIERLKDTEYSDTTLTFSDEVLFSPEQMKNYITANIHTHPNTLMSFYTYHPLYGLTSKIESDLKTTYYEYDPFFRLIRIKDNYENILNQFQYGYKIKK